MKKKNIIAIAIAALVIVVLVIFADRIIERKEPTYIQGTVECKTYKASSKIAGRIDSLLVEEGQHVVKGQLLYTISTPELNAKLIQAEAVRSAAEAMNKKADKGARKPQLEAAKSMWQKADAGLTLAQKTYDRAKALYDKGVVPRQKLDEAQANLDAMRATAEAARAQYDLAVDGATSEEKDATAAQVRQAQGAVDEVESYLSDAMVVSPVTGEISTVISEAGELVGTGYPVVTVLDMSDMWVVFNVKETLMPRITMGKRFSGFVPALDRDVDFVITFISVEADFATWNATRTQGGFDVRTFAVKAKPVTAVEYMRPGMSVIVDWDSIE